MKNFLIITIGTRDVQLRKDLIEKPDSGFQIISGEDNDHWKRLIRAGEVELIASKAHEDFPNYFSADNRSIGKSLFENLDLFEEVIELPLITPVIDSLLNSGKSIDNILLIYTDQQKGLDSGIVKPKNFEKDTLHFKDIIENLLKKRFPEAEFKGYGITEKVTDIDYQYQHFAQARDEFIEADDVNQIFLLPQGGIDQINQAVTLQLLQSFKTKVKLYQKAEEAEATELKFGQYFLYDLNKQKIEKHLRDYDFGMITSDLHPNDQVYHLAQFASKCLDLQYHLLKVNISNLNSYSHIIQKGGDENKLKDLYLSAKINYHQQKYTEFLWKVYTLNETLYKVEVKKVLGKLVDSKGRGSSSSWSVSLDEKNPKFRRIISNHSMPNGDPIDSSRPNRQAFKILMTEFVKAGLIEMSEHKLEIYEKLKDKLEALASGRNNIAHKLGSTSLAQIEAALRPKNKSEIEYKTQDLLADLDALFELSTPFGIYDQIKADIEAILDQPYSTE